MDKTFFASTSIPKIRHSLVNLSVFPYNKVIEGGTTYGSLFESEKPLPHTKKPALIVELKYDQSADTAIRQIKEKHYTQALEGYSGELLLVGINYEKDKENKQHSCVIERHGM